MRTHAEEGIVTPRLTFEPGAYVLVTVTGAGFEVSGAALDLEAAEEWVAGNPLIRRYTDVLFFAMSRERKEGYRESTRRN